MRLAHLQLKEQAFIGPRCNIRAVYHMLSEGTDRCTGPKLGYNAKLLLQDYSGLHPERLV